MFVLGGGNTVDKQVLDFRIAGGGFPCFGKGAESATLSQQTGALPENREPLKHKVTDHANRCGRKELPQMAEGRLIK